MLKPNGFIFCALILIAGCATTPNVPEATISSPPAVGGVPELNWTAPGFDQKSAALVVKTNSPFVVHPNFPAAALPKPSGAPVLTWTSLKRWSAGRKVSAPRLLSNTPVTTYGVSSTHGVMVLAIGSRVAAWNGTEINLGFEPQLIDGEIYLYGLDLQKNLEPLLCESPLVFGTNRVIVIDPGHGGANTGTHSLIDGRFEKELTLDWARRLAPLLETNGWTVFFTRTNDTDIVLSNRVAVAEAHHADLFISLHFNSAAPDTSQSGFETYCLTPAGMPSTITRGFADLWSENFPNNNFDAQNLQIAARVQSQLRHMLGAEDRGVRRARFMGVLHGQNRPAVLIEAGYLSNPAEARLIESGDYRQKLAEAVAGALK